jgi:hypothetical protein
MNQPELQICFVMHRRGTVRAIADQHPIDAAVTLVTVPTASAGRGLNSTNLSELAIQVFIRTPLSGGSS